jgi:L-threonylcarbamoyladenylate synthase
VKTETVAAIHDRRRRSQTGATQRAVELLRKGEVVALPTETVYGLAADALNPIAVAKIFEAKGRPRFDPLIVHLPDHDWLQKIVELQAQGRQLILKLAEKFWPGPFTMVLPKREIIPEIVTAGLDTVAVRISAHPVFSETARALGKPIAAPSANRFGRISPTTAQHVLNELNGRIPLIIDSGPTEHGIESTIVAVQGEGIEILRRGPVTEEDLRSIGFQPMSRRQDADATATLAPGQLPSHYAPETALRLIDAAKSFSPQEDQRVVLLAWNPILSSKDNSPIASASGSRHSLKFVAIRQLSEKQDLREAATNLFRFLRELDALEVDLIVAERVPDRGLGRAINDRLRRAAAK